MEMEDNYQSGLQAKDNGNYADAIKLFSQAIKSGMQKEDVFFQRAYCCSMIHKYELAVRDLDILIQKTENYLYYYNRGLNYLKLNFLEKSIADFSKSISLNPDYESSFYNRSLVYFRMNDFLQCIEDCNTTINLNQKHSRAFYKRGQAKIKAGDRADALRDLNQCLLIQPDFSDALKERAVLLVESGNSEAAITDLNEALKYNPNDISSKEKIRVLQESSTSFHSEEKDSINPAFAFHIRGLAKISVGDYEGALEDYNKAIRIDPKNSQFYYYRSLAKYGRSDQAGALDDRKGAFEDQEKALKLNPEDSKAILYKAIIEANIRKNSDFVIPSNQKKLPWIEYYGVCTPAETLSGDFFFIYSDELNPNSISVTIGDVQGKGAKSTMFMSIALQLLDETRKKISQPETILKQINDILVDKTGGLNRRAKNKSLFITAAYASIENNSKCKLHYSIAGHTTPIILRNGDFIPEANLLIKEKMSLNIIKDFSYTSKSFALESGDLLIFYSDGMIEQSNSETNKSFGMDGLKSLILKNCDKPLDQLYQSLIVAIKQFSNKKLPEDDITFVGIRLK